MIFSLVAMTGLEKCCITSAYLQWLCHSGEWPVACGPLVCNNCCFLQVGGELYFSDIYADRNLSPEARKHEVLWGKIWPICLTSSALQNTIFLANSVDSNETVHYEPSHQDLHHLPFCFRSWMRLGWSGGANVLCILYHWGVQLILAYSWARPAILVVGKGRGGMFLFLLFLHFHSCSSFFPVPLFHLLYSLFYLFSPFLWEMTQNDPQGLTCR